MKKFISYSQSSKQLLKIAKMSADLPVNIIILGQAGVGRKLLANEILPTAECFEAKELEKLIIDKKINLEEYNSMIVYNINKVLNKTEFIEKFKNLKLVATGFSQTEDYLNYFAVKIEIPPLDERTEDLEELTNIYKKEASKIYTSSISSKNIKLDLTGNGITLKQSIYKSILLQSMNKQEMMDTLYNFFVRELQSQRSYKDFLEVFEIPLLKASKKVYKSQLQMAKKLQINRITLRKKLSKYFGE